MIAVCGANERIDLSVNTMKQWSMKTTGLLLLLVSLLSCQGSTSENEIKPTFSNVQESVYGSATIRPSESYFPQANRAGVIKEILVEQGDHVTEGQILFRIAATGVDTRLIDAQLNLSEAKDNFFGKDNALNTLQLELDTEFQQLKLDSINLLRQERLQAQNIGAQLDLDRARLTFESTKNRFRALQQKYTQTYQRLESAYRKALNKVENERSILQEYLVQAQMDGKIYEIFKDEGEVIHPQDKFAEIGSIDNYTLELDIDEVDITKIDLKDTAIISLEAYPEEVFMSVIRRIHPKKDERSQTFLVEASFIEKPPRVYNGLSGEANIIIAKRSNALTIPTEYLSGPNMVRTIDGDKMVSTGITNLNFVEIISGIDSATVLLKPDQE
ncbi:MAG: HlyD family efflux transporter periplasmic adaptor subunit [Saprospiraceae bacterium]|nr:HlyD family efflux transporter periplasmic adaptor subunit [Saprospiraceae bacterium]